MGRSKHSGDLAKYLGGMSGKAAKKLRSRKSRIDSALEQATGKSPAARRNKKKKTKSKSRSGY